MDQNKTVERYLPLTETTYYILLALTQPMHGYAVMQKVEEISAGVVKLGPGTLYGAFSQLEKGKLIVMVSEEERRKCYALTALGKQLLLAQINRLRIMVSSGEKLIQNL
jgi:DNA-binding PadR family transcriptional regulator